MATERPNPEMVASMSLAEIWREALPENTPDHFIGYDWARALRGEIEWRWQTGDPTLPARADALLGLRAELLGQPADEVDPHFSRAADKLSGHDPSSQNARVEVATLWVRSMAVRQLFSPGAPGLDNVRAAADTARSVLRDRHIKGTPWDWKATQLCYYYGLLELVAGEGQRAWTLGKMAVNRARHSRADAISLEQHGKRVRQQVLAGLGLMALTATEIVAGIPGIEELQGTALYHLLDKPNPPVASAF